MSKSLLVVESPAKAKTIKRYLGADFEVAASVGHVKDLPKKTLGVDIEHGFAPDYVTIQGKGKVLAAIKKLAKQVDTVYLAPDPDREGEAIAWHIAEEIGVFEGKAPPTYRVLINEITRRGVTDAIAHPTQINQDKFESQQARRILDRLVGYQISPILWEKVRRGLSAGRVQSVAVRLIVDREAEIQRFVSQEYWTIKAHLDATTPPRFWAGLSKVKQRKAQVERQEQAEAIVAACKQGKWIVDEVSTKERRRQPAAPFTTSKLQQDAARKLRFPAKLTMSVAQRLYEGVDAGSEGAVGLITYMRTDSTRLSNDSVEQCREFIKEHFGEEAMPKSPKVYKTKKGAQDAHEAIRPTDVGRTPESLKRSLSREQFKLYSLIWKRFVACQMEAAVYDQTVIDVVNGEHAFRAQGSVLKSAGFLGVYEEGRDEDTDEKDTDPLPLVAKGDELRLVEMSHEQHFTQPPPRFTEATLVKELEERGIGRPSTYASIISVIQDKGYVDKEALRFQPTELGRVVTELLVTNFPRIMDVEFTATLESDLDKIEDGAANWIDVLTTFYGPFSETLERARSEMRNLKREETPTDLKCDKCGSTMVIKWGRNGSFLACSAYPGCKRSMEFIRDEKGDVQPVVEEPETRGECSDCHKPMVVKTGRFGRFVACSGYPECKHTEPFSLGVACPRDACDGELVEKRSRRGKVFYGCNRYPNCDYATWNRPLPIRCPTCGLANLEESVKRSATQWVCPGCGHSQEPANEGSTHPGP